MIILFITIISTTLISLEAASKYIIGQYINPYETINHAYPLDICVNTEIKGFAVQSSDFIFAKYVCNSQGTQVTRTVYGEDSTCTDSNAGTTTLYSDQTLSVGALNSFNCDGDINYVITKSTKTSVGGTSDCCAVTDVSPQIVVAATEVCFQFGDGNYSKAICGSDGVGTQYTFPTNECIDSVKIEPPAFNYDDSCSKWKTVLGLVDVYLRLDSCYSNGQAIAKSSLCGGGGSESSTISPTYQVQIFYMVPLYLE